MDRSQMLCQRSLADTYGVGSLPHCQTPLEPRTLGYAFGCNKKNFKPQTKPFKPKPENSRSLMQPGRRPSPILRDLSGVFGIQVSGFRVEVLGCCKRGGP